MTGIIRLARTRSIYSLAMISVCSIAITLARNTIWITIISIAATVAIGRSVFFSTFAFAGGIRAISSQIKSVTLTRYRKTKTNDVNDIF